MKTLILHIRSWLSHHPILYAFIGGTGVIIFWRGVWLTVDFLMTLISSHTAAATSMNASQSVWWDGPLSVVLGMIILLFTSAFVSSLIGNEIIISGLRAEKKISATEAKDMHTETMNLEEIRQTLTGVTAKLAELEQEIEEIHTQK
jgi:hypothetical protein